jgi:hypothetical protein
VCTSFYAIGKITKNGWRERFVSRNDMPNDWEGYLNAESLLTHFGFVYWAFLHRLYHGCAHLPDEPFHATKLRD